VAGAQSGCSSPRALCPAQRRGGRAARRARAIGHVCAANPSTHCAGRPDRAVRSGSRAPGPGLSRTVHRVRVRARAPRRRLRRADAPVQRHRVSTSARPQRPHGGADPNFNTPPHILATMLRQACYGLIPVLVIIAAVMLRRRRGQPTLALFTFVLASGTLIQFPTALDQYFLYVAPLVVLVALALVVDRTTQQPRPRGIAAGVAALFLVWAVGRTEFSPVYHRRTARLNVPRGGPLVEWFMVPMYQKLVALVDAHARGRYIYAGPDSPHVYFLTGKQNPTPT